MRDLGLERAAERIRAARRIAVLTGAGISTPSGIPDFRSANGWYATERNVGVFEIEEFRRHPESFYRFARKFYPLLMRAQPNIAHLTLARWQTAERDVAIATQNIDDLHQRAGSRRVYPVHGTWETSSCISCGACQATNDLVPEVMAGRVPRCACGGVMKPDITFFGELLPPDAWEGAVAAMRAADLVLVVGTSLVVQPAASLPLYRSPRVPLIIVNRDPTDLDDQAEVVLRGDLTDVFRALAERTGLDL